MNETTLKAIVVIAVCLTFCVFFHECANCWTAPSNKGATWCDNLLISANSCSDEESGKDKCEFFREQLKRDCGKVAEQKQSSDDDTISRTNQKD